MNNFIKFIKIIKINQVLCSILIW